MQRPWGVRHTPSRFGQSWGMTEGWRTELAGRPGSDHVGPRGHGGRTGFAPAEGEQGSATADVLHKMSSFVAPEKCKRRITSRPSKSTLQYMPETLEPDTPTLGCPCTAE